MGRFGEAANRLEILLAGGKLSVSVGYIWVGAERHQTDWKFYWLGKKNVCFSAVHNYVSVGYIWVGAERQQTDWKFYWLGGEKKICFDAVHMGRS